MTPSRIRCQAYESVTTRLSRLSSLDQAIREIDPESDPGISRLMIRLREVIECRLYSSGITRELFSEAEPPLWPDLPNPGSLPPRWR